MNNDFGFRNFGSDTKLMWDEEGYRVCGEDFGRIEKNMDLGIEYNHGSQPDFGFTALFDSIHEIKPKHTKIS